MTSEGIFRNNLWHVGWRYLWLHRWQSLLMVLGITLGVAVVVSIDLANASAGRAFALSTESVTGRTTHQLFGGPLGVEESLYRDIKLQSSVPSAPVINEYITSPQLGSLPMQLLGIDPFSEAPFRSFLGEQVVDRGDVPAGPDLSGLALFLAQPGAVLLSEETAQRYALEPGDPFTIVIGGRAQEVFLAGVVQSGGGLNARTLEGLVIADIATAQELASMEGYLSRIDFILPEDDPAAASELSQTLPAGYRLVESDARTGTIRQMTEAFQVNLSALSLLALVVGLFLIYNTMTFSIVQRRSLFGTLRCLGVTRKEVFMLVLSEAFLVGLIGSLAGIALGLLLGQVTVGMVTQTVNDLYFTTTVQDVGIAPESLLKGALLGILATMFTAALPAWEAASVPPRAALLRSGLEAKTRGRIGWIALAGVLSGLFGLILFQFPTNSIFLGFAGTLAVILGFALLSAALLVGFLRALVPLTGRLFGLIGRMAPRNLINALSRTAVAVAALMVAVAVIIGVGLMIDSFRYTVIVWLEQTLQGDVYISVPAFNATRSSFAIDPGVVQTVESWPGISSVDVLRSVSVESRVGMVNLAATDNPRLGEERLFARLEGQTEEVWARMQAGGVLLSEPFANRLGNVNAGDSVALYTGRGWESFPVVGVFYDYASSEGTVLMALDVYRSLWQDQALTALGVRLAPGGDAQQIASEMQDRLAGDQELIIRPNQELRQDVLDVFDRTFAITVALRVLATVVAFIGVLNALLLLQLEKQREVGILRALGLTGKQLWQLVMVETGLMGLTAGLLAIPTGYILALILVYVINRRSFGWTLQMTAEPAVFLQAVLIALLAALLAGIIPALRMGRLSPAEAIRYE